MQLEFDALKAQPLKMTPLEADGLQIQLAAASKIPDSRAAAPLPGTSIRSLLQDMGLQVWPFKPHHAPLQHSACALPTLPMTSSMSLVMTHILRQDVGLQNCLL